MPDGRQPLSSVAVPLTIRPVSAVALRIWLRIGLGIVDIGARTFDDGGCPNV